jgi:hypothetical protein
MKTLSWTCVRNEGPFLLEWIAYHRLIGVTEFIVFSNDCDDGSDRLLDALAKQGVLRHIEQTIETDKSVQWQAAQRMHKHRWIHDFDWAMFTDVDEFPVIHAGDGRLDDLFAGITGDTDAVAMPWRLFGSGGKVMFEDQPVTRQFTRSAPRDLYHPVAGRFIKTLFRPSRFGKPGIHRPKRDTSLPVPRWVDGSGAQMAEAFSEHDGRISIPALSVGRDLVELNHYSLRSAQSFLVKAWRGLANRRGKEIDLSYWVERNFNTVENTGLSRWDAALDTEIAALRSLPGVAGLHDHACDWHRNRARALVRTPTGYRLFCNCLHAAGSAALPRDLALQLYAEFAKIET